MKRLALLSVIALMLASAVFAPAAMAQEPGELVMSFRPDGELFVALIDRDSVLTAVAFDPDGKLLASATWIDWKDIPLTAKWKQEVFSAIDNFEGVG
jgi:hypothetical protein